MARKLRLECNDGIYHVINRGNYRTAIFDTNKTKEAFEKVLFEACEKTGWWLYAYVIVGNHFHLAIGTPQGNLVSGMQWLQATFANRFNRFRKVNGHLFQGRYKSLQVEPGKHLLQLVSYIHLNPVRAHIVKIGELKKYPFSSLPKYFMKKRPSFFHCRDWLYDVGKLVDNRSGWLRYMDHLKFACTTNRKEIEKIHRQMTWGWCIGSNDYKEALVKDYRERKELLHIKGEELQEWNELNWKYTLERCLQKLKKSKEDIRNDKKSVEWKLAVAVKLKYETSATNSWISERLNMGHYNALSHNVSVFKRENMKFSKAIKALAAI